MSTDKRKIGEPIRMVFELSHEDHPLLYKDLMRFPKGTKRINRLRLLAYDGLLVQVGCIAPLGMRTPDSAVPGHVIDDSLAVLTNDLFGPSLKD